MDDQVDKTILRPYTYFKDKYAVSGDEMRNARENGLPATRIGGYWYYRECDFNDYYAGKIGIRSRWNRNGHKNKKA